MDTLFNFAQMSLQGDPRLFSPTGDYEGSREQRIWKHFVNDKPFHELHFIITVRDHMALDAGTWAPISQLQPLQGTYAQHPVSPLGSCLHPRNAVC